jgi:phosphoenolpyruvate synthase/pyruvate phosphate dikinase
VDWGNIWWNKNSDMLRTNWSLNSSEIEKICKIALAVERKYEHAQDMELVFQNEELYIVQTRNITTI